VPTSVLIVEDAAAARSLFEDALRMAGFSVRAISLAADTFEALRTATPDVIVLDLGMPRGTLQGMEMLTRLREVEAWREIPVIILSGFGELVNRDITRRLGVAAILTKPLRDTDELARTIRQIQGTTEARGACGGLL
jgi:two-component system, OmpR family, response regulator CpxR